MAFYPSRKPVSTVDQLRLLRPHMHFQRLTLCKLLKACFKFAHGQGVADQRCHINHTLLQPGDDGLGSERERKRTPRMKVTGKGVQTLSRLMTTKSAKKR